MENRDWSIRPPWQNMAEFGRSRVSTKFHLSFPPFSTCTAICGNLRQSGAICLCRLSDKSTVYSLVGWVILKIRLGRTLMTPHCNPGRSAQSAQYEKSLLPHEGPTTQRRIARFGPHFTHAAP